MFCGEMLIRSVNMLTIVKNMVLLPFFRKFSSAAVAVDNSHLGFGQWLFEGVSFHLVRVKLRDDIPARGALESYIFKVVDETDL